MDPKECMRQIKQLSLKILTTEDKYVYKKESLYDNEHFIGDCIELANCISCLNDWNIRGGFAPGDFNAAIFHTMSVFASELLNTQNTSTIPQRYDITRKGLLLADLARRLN